MASCVLAGQLLRLAPRLMLMSCAPLSAAKVIALSMSENEPVPVQSMTFKGSRRAPPAMPATPWPLFVCAAIGPDTWEPGVKGEVGARQPSSSGLEAAGHELDGADRKPCCAGVLPDA